VSRRYQETASFFAMAFKPFRDMFVFSGRSRRTEVGAFFLLGTVANFFSISGDDSDQLLRMVHVGWALLWGFPWIALFVRRLHDQGKSARWAIALGLPFTVAWATAPFLPQSPDSIYRVTLFGWTFHPVGPLAIAQGIFALLAALCIFGLCLAEGDPGTNRYGPDPRLDRVAEA
jgi:uncharacterized membrane protein YhaH (DUF805 family)